MARCKTADLLVHHLTPADADALQTWVDTGTNSHGVDVSAQQVTDALHRDGYDVSVHTVRRHRASTCVCHG